MQYKVNSKESFYFVLLCVINALLFAAIAVALGVSRFPVTSIFFYVACFIAYFWLQSLMLAGYLRGNALRVNERQFPEAYSLLKHHAERLELTQIPEMYVLQGHGMINAFAVRLARRNHVVLFSDVLDLAYQEGEKELSFIIGHELGHVKRGHIGWLKALCTWPARWIPFLGSAYSRACEYTCDNIGFALCPEGALKGTLILAVGKRLYKYVDVEQAIADFKNENGFAVSLVEVFSSHPVLMKRLDSLNRLRREQI